jgi:hypothetical protein
MNLISILKLQVTLRGWTAPLLGPSSIQQISVPWHIGATGGYVYYNLDITIKGPKGVPYY